MNEWTTLPYIDFSGIGQQEQPVFRSGVDCPFNWEWIALAFVAGALLVYYAKR